MELSDDVIVIITTYSTVDICFHLVSITPAIAYHPSVWKSKAEYETQGLLPNRKLVTGYFNLLMPDSIISDRFSVFHTIEGLKVFSGPNLRGQVKIGGIRVRRGISRIDPSDSQYQQGVAVVTERGQLWTMWFTASRTPERYGPTLINTPDIVCDFAQHPKHHYPCIITRNGRLLRSTSAIWCADARVGWFPENSLHLSLVEAIQLTILHKAIYILTSDGEVLMVPPGTRVAKGIISLPEWIKEDES